MAVAKVPLKKEGSDECEGRGSQRQSASPQDLRRRDTGLGSLSRKREGARRLVVVEAVGEAQALVEELLRLGRRRDLPVQRAEIVEREGAVRERDDARRWSGLAATAAIAVACLLSSFPSWTSSSAVSSLS